MVNNTDKEVHVNFYISESKLITLKRLPPYKDKCTSDVFRLVVDNVLEAWGVINDPNKEVNNNVEEMLKHTL